MCDASRLRSMNVADSEATGSLSGRKPASKPLRNLGKSPAEVSVVEEEKSPSVIYRRASTGRLIRSNSEGTRRKPCASKPKSDVSDGGLDLPSDGSHQKKRCSWVATNTDASYAAFHDEEWGVPVHDDKKLFELLVLFGCVVRT